MRANSIHTVLTHKRLKMGVDPRLAVINGVITAEMLLVFKWPPYLIVTLLTHLIFVYITKQDEQTVKIYGQFLHQSNYYDPWAHPSDDSGARPDGFMRQHL